jgi:hypothetical protein
MTYIELIRQLAKRLGQHQIPLNAEAKELRRLLDSSALHYELMTKILRAVYDRNHCRALNDPVDSDATYEALGPLRLEVLRSPKTDVDLYRLMEDLCVAIALVFNQQQQTTDQDSARFSPDEAQTESGDLLTFHPHRRFMDR